MLRVFECLCFSCLRAYNGYKLLPRSLPCTFLGYSPTHKDYKCLSSALMNNYFALAIVTLICLLLCHSHYLIEEFYLLFILLISLLPFLIICLCHHFLEILLYLPLLCLLLLLCYHQISQYLCLILPLFHLFCSMLLLIQLIVVTRSKVGVYKPKTYMA